jgi:trigger factor
VPSFEPGDYATVTLRRPSSQVEEAAVEQALQRLRERAARFEPVEDRAVAEGDTVTLDIDRSGGNDPAGEAGASGAKKERHTDVAVELGAKANPPGFDQELQGLETGATKSFTTHYPADYPIGELANTDVSYTVTVKDIKRRVLPELDDEFAKDLGDLSDPRCVEGPRSGRPGARGAARRRAGSSGGAHEAARRARPLRSAGLAHRTGARSPPRRVRAPADRQNVDPRQAGIDWNAFRESQREVAREAVAGAIVLDEVARREHLDVSAEDMDREIERYAERSGRSAAAVRAGLEKEGGLSRVSAGLRRDKTVDFLLGRAIISTE